MAKITDEMPKIIAPNQKPGALLHASFLLTCLTSLTEHHIPMIW